MSTHRLFSRSLFPQWNRALPLLCCLLLLSMAAAGCQKITLPGWGDSEPARTQPPPPPKLSPLDEARSTFARGDYTQAETLALRLVEGGTLSGPDGAEAGRILAASALRNNHPHVALTGLEHWRTAASGADSGKEWQDAWCKALRGLSSHDARTRANTLYQDASRSLPARSVAGVVMAVRQWQDGELGQTMPALENIYATAANSKEKAAIEGRLALELSKAGQAASALAATAVTEENRDAFPYVIINIDQLRRRLQNPNTREEAQAALNDLKDRARLAAPSLVSGPPKEGDISISAPSDTTASLPATVSGQPVVLALPLSGQFAGISSKIVAGAQAACDELSTSGGKVSLVVIDTDKPDWIAQADALSAEAAVIGGPLRPADYNTAKSAGLTSRRAMLTFLPSLDTGDEGRVAWRFFSSASDQVDTLLQFTSRLGISSYGVFYPEEKFGQRMSSLFEERARAAGAQSVITGSYDPGSQTGWMTSAKNFLTSAKGSAAFKAIFLPDSWKNMDVIVPNFFYYNETRQVLMGTSLWERGLSGNSFVSAQYYGLAVFPGAWNPGQPNSAGQKLSSRLSSSGKGSPDFWAGLGYDFARLSARLGVTQGWTPEQVNSALAGASSLDWSLAPITWSGGRASQRMFLFTPKENGFAPVDEAAFKAAFDAAWSK